MKTFLVEGEFEIDNLSSLEIANGNCVISIRKAGHAYEAALYLLADDADEAELKYNKYILESFPKAKEVSVIDISETVNFYNLKKN